MALQAELLHTIAVANNNPERRSRHQRQEGGDAVPATAPPAGDEASRLAVRPREPDRREAEELARRVRQRRE